MYWIDETSKNFGSSHQVDFLCDTSEDISNLPTSTAPGVKQGDNDVSYLPVAIGSSCLVIGESSLYMLDSTDTWVEM